MDFLGNLEALFSFVSKFTRETVCRATETSRRLYRGCSTVFLDAEVVGSRISRVNHCCDGLLTIICLSMICRLELVELVSITYELKETMAIPE